MLDQQLVKWSYGVAGKIGDKAFDVRDGGIRVFRDGEAAAIIRHEIKRLIGALEFIADSDCDCGGVQRAKAELTRLEA